MRRSVIPVLSAIGFTLGDSRVRLHIAAFAVLIGLQGFVSSKGLAATDPASALPEYGRVGVTQADPRVGRWGARSAFPQAQQAATAAAPVLRSRFEVMVPEATGFIDESKIFPNEAALFVENALVEGSGDLRIVESGPLESGRTYRYLFTVKWRSVGYSELVRSKTVEFVAGDIVRIDLTRDEGNDRSQVVYVPTPNQIAAAMVALAHITPDDVVYEPGCGDARITIAAVKAGARRGIGVDIDPDRVAEARANVKSAGLEDRIEIRQGDALDIKDLSNATVVFLFMGPEFNLLFRPVLWKQLEVGARVVSHEFTMGNDWTPDRSISTTDAEFAWAGQFDLHLWTITQQVKDRVR
jgi:uncharacterized protein (TIGR03000 family)